MLSIFTSFTACPCSQASQRVHVHKLHNVSMFTSFTTCPCSQASQRVHVHKLHNVSMFTSFTTCSCSQTSQRVHVHKFHNVSMFTSFTACPCSQASQCHWNITRKRCVDADTWRNLAWLSFVDFFQSNCEWPLYWHLEWTNVKCKNGPMLNVRMDQC